MFELRGILRSFLLLISLNHLTNGTCDFKDSVDLSNITAFENGTFAFGETNIAKEFVHIFDYKVNNESNEHIPAVSHPRGCICELKPCIQFCCFLNARFNGSNCVRTSLRYSPVMYILDRGISQEEDITSIFHQIFHRPTYLGKKVELQPIMENDFVLFKNGTLYSFSDNTTFTMNDFCLTPFYQKSTRKIQLLPLVSSRVFPDADTDNDKNNMLLDSFSMFFSVPFMILTIIVYMGVTKLRTVYGKSLCCYLFGLCIGYVCVSMMKTEIIAARDHKICKSLGYLVYFVFMSSFFWLSAISFNVYMNIRSNIPRKNGFKLYCLYSWGLALICLILTFSADNTSWISDELKPSVCNEYYFLNVKVGWSAMIYFYGPLTVVIGFNITMFALTAVYIQAVKHGLSRIEDSQQLQKTERNWFAVFFRLFIVMGVTWSMEIISYLAGHKFEHIFILTDICNAIQGFTIFVIFVAKKSVWKKITERTSIRSSTKMTYLDTEKSRNSNKITHGTTGPNE